MNLSDIDVAILCGGQGSRIRDYLPPGLPKCMTDINGTPFIQILLQRLIWAGFGKIILCAGYGADIIEKKYRDAMIVYRNAKPPFSSVPQIRFSRESGPLGTGGAIVNALLMIESDPFLVVNGDTICDIDFKALLDNHLQVRFPITVPIDDTYRNVGVYVVTKAAMQIAASNLGPKFDLDEAVGSFPEAGVPVNWHRTTAAFHDIGTPQGLHEFRTLQENMPIDDHS